MSAPDHHFEVDGDGVHAVRRGGRTWLSAPLHLVAHGRDATGARWHYLLEGRSLDGKPERVLVPRSATARDLVATLADRGVDVAQADGSAELLLAFVRSRRTSARVRLLEDGAWCTDDDGPACLTEVAS